MNIYGINIITIIIYTYCGYKLYCLFCCKCVWKYGDRVTEFPERLLHFDAPPSAMPKCI